MSAVLAAAGDSVARPRIADLVAGQGDRPWVAFEFFPPKTETGVANLYSRLGRLAECKPLYIDFTWGAGGSTSDLTLELTQQSQERFGYVANMHLTCTNMPRYKLDQALEVARKVGITNILALRGDPPAGQKDFQAVDTGFGCALDLVRHIKAQPEGAAFCISVAGYPEGHPDRIKKVLAGQSLTASERERSVRMDDGYLYVCSDRDFEEELVYLKQKQDAGAEMIVTQMFYDVHVFLSFVRQCRAFGITVPIVPGIMCITSYAGYKRMCGFCKTRVPDGMARRMEEIKEDETAVLDYAIEWAVETCKTLLAHPDGSKGLHFYTLNIDKIVLPVLSQLGLLPEDADIH
jgi:methylenetetrahydrofolate reductase (NADPH)